MNYGEGRSIAELISSVLTVLIYGTGVILALVYEWVAINDILQFWAIVILGFIPVSVIVRVVVAVFYSVGNTVAHEIKGEFPEDDDIVDERDRMIMLKATRNSMFIFIAGFIVGLVFLAFKLSPHFFFGSIVLFGILTDFVQTALTIIYYRRGV